MVQLWVVKILVKFPIVDIEYLVKSKKYFISDIHIFFPPDV